MYCTDYCTYLWLLCDLVLYLNSRLSCALAKNPRCTASVLSQTAHPHFCSHLATWDFLILHLSCTPQRTSAIGRCSRGHCAAPIASQIAWWSGLAGIGGPRSHLRRGLAARVCLAASTTAFSTATCILQIARGTRPLVVLHGRSHENIASVDERSKCCAHGKRGVVVTGQHD